MEKQSFHLWILIATICSVGIAYSMAARRARRRYGNTDADAISGAWLNVLISCLPLFAHLAITKSIHDVQAIFASPDLSLTAALITFLGIMEICGGFGLCLAKPIKPDRVQALAAITLICFAASVATGLSEYQSESPSLLAAVWNTLLVSAALIAYFATGGVVRLAKARLDES